MKLNTKLTRVAVALAGLVTVALLSQLRAANQSRPAKIDRVSRMPNMPQPYAMRDWAQVTRDYLDLAFDFERRGQSLPLVSWLDESRKMVSLPSYVGGAHDPEAINYLGAVISGSQVGLDMRNYRGQDWVAMSTSFFNADEGVYVNALGGQTGKSFWYDILPNVLAFQLNSLYPGDSAQDQRALSVAEKWNQVSDALCDKSTSNQLPNFDHTGFRLSAMQPSEMGWIEPEAAAGIAWLEYMAWTRFKDPRFFRTADLAIRTLIERNAERSPLYEVLMPYGALAAVRMNCEQHRNYDVDKLLAFSFDPHGRPQARPGWGVIVGRWNGLDAAGLVGSTTDGEGYAFAMNTFQWAGALAPIARYDTRYAHDIGKWILNLANAARLFYPATFDADHQSSFAWSHAHDPKSVIAYEGVRKWKRGASTASADVSTTNGKLIKGSYASTRLRNESPPDMEVFEETASGKERFEHIWEVNVPEIADRWLIVDAKRIDGGHANNEFQFSLACQSDGPFKPVFSVSNSEPSHVAALPPEIGKRLYIKVASASPASEEARDQLAIDAMAVTYRDTIGPFAQGDAVVSFIDLIRDATVPIVLYRPPSPATDLGLYGSSHVGILGGIVRETNVQGILQLDLLKTDYFHDHALPTYLYYNPHATTESVEIDVGHELKDVYDAIADEVILRNVRGKVRFTMPEDAARVLVLAPAGGELRHDGNRTLIGEIVVRYAN